VNFVRVVHRQGWDVELVEGAGVRKENFPDREAALEYARSLSPDWIELGEVEFAHDDVPQHHRWTTLRRNLDGSYAPSNLKWGGLKGG
jgi:hypothetical protein